MRDENQVCYTVGELARRSGVTVRTLQYYDQHGLLKPSRFSEGGRRLYDRQDMLRLQQIIFLKAMGFSLDQIRDRLLPTVTGEQLTRLFEEQKAAIKQQILSLHQALELLEQGIRETADGHDIALEALFAIVGAVRQGNPYAFMLRRLDSSDLSYYLDKVAGANDSQDLQTELNQLTDVLLGLHRAGADPLGSAGQDLACRWWALMQQLTDGDPERMQSLFAAGADDAAWPRESADLKAAMTGFLGIALAAHLEKQGINMPQPEEGT